MWELPKTPTTCISILLPWIFQQSPRYEIVSETKTEADSVNTTAGTVMATSNLTTPAPAMGSTEELESVGNGTIGNSGVGNFKVPFLVTFFGFSKFEEHYVVEPDFSWIYI